MRHSFFGVGDLATLLDLSPRTILKYRRRAGIKKRGEVKNQPEFHSIPTNINLQEGWDTPEWWRAHYPRYGMRILTRVTGLNYLTVRRRIERHCPGGIRKYGEAVKSKHPCCTEKWIREHYEEQELSQYKCASIAGVSPSTFRDWLVRFKIPIRSYYAHSLMDQAGGLRTNEAENSSQD
jgi:hypothetical protein